MPHQQKLPSQPQQQEDPSAAYHQGPVYPFSSNSASSPPFSMPQYPPVVPYNRGYGMVAPVHNTNRQMYHLNSEGDWNNGSPFKNHKYLKHDDGDESDSKNAISPGKKGSHESDEEAAVAALLMAGGPRSENVESMQAAVRKKKLSMNKQNTDSSPSNKNSDDHDSTVTSSQDERKSISIREEVGGGNGSSAIVKDFPYVLHEVLTESEYSGTVLEWLSHGKSWRILRWDELSHSVIPAYFPELCAKSGCDDAQSFATERMNLFIRQINAWGFKEVREVGPDLGSFQHEVRASKQLQNF